MKILYQQLINRMDRMGRKRPKSGHFLLSILSLLLIAFMELIP